MLQCICFLEFSAVTALIRSDGSQVAWSQVFASITYLMWPGKLRPKIQEKNTVASGYFLSFRLKIVLPKIHKLHLKNILFRQVATSLYSHTLWCRPKMIEYHGLLICLCKLTKITFTEATLHSDWLAHRIRYQHICIHKNGDFLSLSFKILINHSWLLNSFQSK